MNILIKRRYLTSKSTIGEMYLDGDFECYTLEDAVRQVKIPGQTAIPAGTYEVVVTWSNRFKRRMPLLLDVPDYQGVRFHAGNTVEDTEGCPLLGDNVDIEHGVICGGTSRPAFDRFFLKLHDALERGKVYATFVNEPYTAPDVDSEISV